MYNCDVKLCNYKAIVYGSKFTIMNVECGTPRA